MKMVLLQIHQSHNCYGHDAIRKCRLLPQIIAYYADNNIVTY